MPTPITTNTLLYGDNLASLLREPRASRRSYERSSRW